MLYRDNIHKIQALIVVSFNSQFISEEYKADAQYI